MLRLEPKYRPRTPEEIESEREDLYREFLYERAAQGHIWALLTRLKSTKAQKEAIDMLVDLVVDDNRSGEGDKEFEKSVDWDAISWSVE